MNLDVQIWLLMAVRVLLINTVVAVFTRSVFDFLVIAAVAQVVLLATERSAELRAEGAAS